LLSYPIVAGPNPAGQHFADKAMKAASYQTHILVVDDEPKLRWISMAKLMLRSSVSLQPSSAHKVGLYRYMYRSTVPDKSAVAMPLRAYGIVATDRVKSEQFCTNLLIHNRSQLSYVINNKWQQLQ
jgi:hypothetical protein